MDHHCSDSDSSDESIASDHSKEDPPSFSCDGNQPEDMCQGKLEDEMKRSIEELQSEVDRNHQTLMHQIKELNDTIDELESVHKNTTVGSLVGSSIGAAGGIASIAGLCLALFTLGASLALTVGGVAAGVATGAASNITNMMKQKTLRQTIKKIIKDFLNIVMPMEKLLSKIYDITEDIEFVEQTLKKHEFQRAARGAEDILKTAEVAGLAQIGKMCAEAAKEIRLCVEPVKAALGPARAAKAVHTGAFSALFHALDVSRIVQDSAELSEINQPADKRKAEETKSETLKCILQMRETADQFKKIVDKITDTIDTFSSSPAKH